MHPFMDYEDNFEYSVFLEILKIVADINSISKVTYCGGNFSYCLEKLKGVPILFGCKTFGLKVFSYRAGKINENFEKPILTEIFNT